MSPLLRLICCLFVMLLFTDKAPRAVPPGTFPPVEKPVRVRISFTGDLMCHMPQVENARIGNDSFDFRPCFAPVAGFLQTDDLTVGNFETTCAGRDQVYTGYPAFNTPDAFPFALKEAGFDFLGMANNHSLDRGEAGLLRTLDVADRYGLGYAGTFRTSRDRDSVRVVSAGGITVAILNYTYGTNGAYPSAEHQYMLAVIDTVRMKSDIAAARKAGARVVTLFLHFGEEMKSGPTPFQDSIAGFAIRTGADLVIGSHPHVIGPARFFKTMNAGLDTGFVAYSLGNFFSNQYWRYTDAGVILSVVLEKYPKSGKVRIAAVEYLPTWVYRGTNPARKLHIVFPAAQAASDTTLTFLNDESRAKAKEALDDTRIMMESSADPRIRQRK